MPCLAYTIVPIFLCERFDVWANNLKVFAAFAVVVLHVAAGFVGGIEVSDPLYGNYEWWAGNIYDSLTRWCVPLFVMISGYFLLNKEEPIQVFFRKRLNKILIPLIFWSLFFSFWTALKFGVKGELSDAPIAIVKGWVLGKPYFHLWYLFMIPFLYLITPALRIVFNKLSNNETLFLVLFCLSLAVLNTLSGNVLSYFGLSAKVTLFTNNFLSYIGYFCLGGYFSKYELKKRNSFAFTTLIVAWVVTIFGSYFFTYKYFYSYLSINTVIASIALFLLIKWHCNKDFRLSSISKLSLGIYLVHPVFLDAISFIGKDWFLSRLDVYMYIPLVSVIVFSLSYLSALLMSKIRFLDKCV